MNKKETGEKGKLFLILQFKLINVDRMIEIEDYYSSNNTEIIISGKDPQWMLKVDILKLHFHKLFVNNKGITFQ